MSTPNERGISFKIQFEENPEKKPAYQALLFNSSGKNVFRQKVESDTFTVPADEKQFRGGRLFLIPILPEREEKEISLERVNRQAGNHEIILPAALKPGAEISITIPRPVWDYWFFCRCHVRGRVFNNCDGFNHPVMNARVHICEVDSIRWWLNRLPDADILHIRDEVLEKVRQKIPIPRPDPGPLTPERLTQELPESHAMSAMKFNIQSAAGDTETQVTRASLAASDILPKENLIAFYADSAASVRAYLLQHYKLLTPIWCWIKGLFLHSDEIRTVYTNDAGWFEADIWYWCVSDHPDLYFWVEYNINGVWTTVYRPAIGCHTFWNYACNSEVDIYLDDPRIPCTSNPTVPGKVVIVTTLGNNVNVSRVSQTGAHKGLSDRIYYTDALPGPFGGTIEPHVIFGEDLLSGPDSVKYYRWSYRKEGDAEWKQMPHAVTRHSLHIEYVGSLPVPSFPVYSLGPDINGLVEIQTPRHPDTNDPWAILDARADTATAFFETIKDNLGMDEVNPEYYELKLELFHADKSKADFAADGISLFMPEASQVGPFGQNAVTTVPIDNTHNTAYQYLDEGTSNFCGFKMSIRVDNNHTSASINETWVDNTANRAGECGMIRYADKNTSKAHISFRAKHPFDFAWFGFSIHKGSSGTVHSASGNVNNVPPLTALDRNPTPPPSYVASADAYAFNHANWQFDVDKPVARLLEHCNEAAFAETLSVHSTATDGWGRLNYDASDVKAFALKQ